MSQKNILLFIVPVFIMIVVWISFSIYHNAVSSTIPESVNIQIFPITPSFDTKTIEKIKNRKTVIPLYESSPAVSQGIATEPAGLVANESSPSANATQGGSLTP